jgi:hypothetical protein
VSRRPASKTSPDVEPVTVRIEHLDYAADVIVLAYATAVQAKRGFERALHWQDRHPGCNVGALRLTRNPAIASHNSVEGGEIGPALVLLSEDPANLRHCLAEVRKVASGELRRPTPDFARAIVLRRLQRAVARAGEGPVTDVIRRHDDRGASIDQFGNVREQA